MRKVSWSWPPLNLRGAFEFSKGANNALMYCRVCKIEVTTAVHKRCPECNKGKNGLYYAEDSIP